MNFLAKYLIEQIKGKTIAVFGGGFKPPTKGHFGVVKQALKQNPEIDEFRIYVGTGERGGITQSQSVLIWEIYNKYLPFKVQIIPSEVAPIKAIYDTAKENPQDEVLWVIGARDGNEEDFNDIAKRTASINKYPNLELRTIVSKNGTSGTAARSALQVSDEKFLSFLPNELDKDERQQVLDIVSNKEQINEGEKENLNEHATYTNSINILERIAELTNHMLDKGMNIEPLPTLELIDGDSKNASDFLGKTAYYDPENKHIVLYTEGRHPKDIVRSYAHEMIHHIQNLEGRLGNITTTNTTEDDNLTKLEQEANLRGTMTFRNWTDSILNESIVGEKIKCDKCGWSWNIVDGGDDLFTCHKCMNINEGKKKDPFGLNAYAMELGRLREEESEYKVYLDMDGVLADFDQRFRDISGMEPRDFENKYGTKAFWNLIDEENKVKFWVGIPTMPGAADLVDAVKNYDYELLTSPSAKKQSYLGKILWVKNHIGSVFPSKPRINFKKAKEKHLVKPQLAKTDILIDDREDTIGRWNAAGGTGIIYKNISQVLNDLGKLGL